MEDQKLAIDEAGREARHAAVKSRVQDEVNAEIAARADRAVSTDVEKVSEIAGELRGKALKEVVGTDREVERARALARVSQVVDYVFCVIYALLAIRLALGLMAARSTAGFVQLIRIVTDPLYAMFRGIVPSPSIEGGFTLVVPLLIAIAVYALGHVAINGLLRLVAKRKTQI